MDLFVTNIPDRISQEELTLFFRQSLQRHGCSSVFCEKHKNKPCARVTIPDVLAAQKFLALCAIQPLKFRNNILRCQVDKTNQRNQLVLASLAKESVDRQRKENEPLKRRSRDVVTQRQFNVAKIELGMWSYRDTSLVFLSCFHDNRSGFLILGRKSLAIILRSNSAQPQNTRVDMRYHTIDSVTLGNDSVTFALNQPPSFFMIESDSVPNRDQPQFETLSLTSRSKLIQSQFNTTRICSPTGQYNAQMGATMVYRVSLEDRAQMHLIKQLLDAPGVCGAIMWPTSSRNYQQFHTDVESLKQLLLKKDRNQSMPFIVQYQLQRLAYNGFLSPSTVLKLLPHVEVMRKDYTAIALAQALRKLGNNLPFPGPSIDAQTYGVSTLLASIRQYASTFVLSGSIYDLARKHSHMSLIHHVQVTPSGTYFEGPDLMPKNRVLRKYSDFMEHFIRVEFTDEDGERIHTPYGVLNDKVFERFRTVLDGSVDVAGRSFVFLGFSHSSLRAHTCWFLHPFIFEGSLLLAKQLIKGLGDFSKIRSPAKCAARIGQTFSDTTESIHIPEYAVEKIPDIERNGRCFTDGVGSISQECLQKVWKEFTRSRKHRATSLQIRYKGAKGMLALDKTLSGLKIRLRDSMIKFEGASDDNNLEICGAAYKPLPMYLNRDFVKVLEDLGVLPAAFLALQSKQVKKLEDIIQSPINAARFLEEDEFLENIIQLAALTQLRDMKYRARILVDEGSTLYGVVDETGLLQENEVYVSARDPTDGTRRVLEGWIIVTRSPARHPGDIRVAKAVSIPDTSPLASLHNCVVFSQHGARDLPSQLSGGDLDGDVFNIVFDRSLWRGRIAEAADYTRLPPLDIGREVESRDIVDFFVTFMKTDALGRICNIHTQIADQKLTGTFDPVCINLAEMASTAVDYSKTGIAVDLTKLPGPKDYNRRCKPDFMADGPSILLSDKITVAPKEPDEGEVDVVDVLEPDNKPVVYYPSQKALGQLYRAIDERKFLDTMHIRAHSRPGRVFAREPMKALFDLILRTTLNIQYTHHRNIAREIRDCYEEAMAETMFQYSTHPNHHCLSMKYFAGLSLERTEEYLATDSGTRLST